MKLRWSAALGALGCALVAGGVAGCGEVPILPQWNADWYVPLPSQAVNFGNYYVGTLPPNTGFNFSPAPQTQDMNGAIGAILKKDLRGGSVILTLRKQTQVYTDDTLYVGESAAALTAGNARTILFVLNMQTTDTIAVDTTVITATNIQMLSDVASSNGTLWVKLAGRFGTGANAATISTSDSLSVRTALVATIAMSR